MRDVHAELQAAGIVVLGVSFDEPEVNARFVEAESFPFALLSDERRELAVAVGAASDADQSHARRISYLVGPDGRVEVAYPSVDPATHAREVLADVADRAGSKAAPQP